MGVALDTYDEESGIHPRNKQLVSGRLASAGLNVAYGMTDYPTNGPFPSAWNFAQLEDGIQVDVLYDQDFTWDPIESEGFYTCCLDSIEDCNNRNGAWEKVLLDYFYSWACSVKLLIISRLLIFGLFTSGLFISGLFISGLFIPIYYSFP